MTSAGAQERLGGANLEPPAWWLANRYPEVCDAFMEFGGSDLLEDWLRNYHAAVIAERSRPRRPQSPE